MPVWTATKVAELLYLRDQGLSFTEVAKKLGGFSRNAVIGKYQRVSRRMKGLPDYYKEPTKKKSTTKRHIRKKVINHPRPKPPPPKEFVLKELKKPEPRVPNPAPIMPTLDKRAMVKSLVHLHDKVDQLTDMECKYPIGQISDPDFTFCFAPATQYGRSYCDEHHELCFTRPAGRPKKRANYAPTARVWRP